MITNKKAIELWYKLEIREDFRERVFQLRRALNIPPRGHNENDFLNTAKGLDVYLVLENKKLIEANFSKLINENKIFGKEALKSLIGDYIIYGNWKVEWNWLGFPPITCNRLSLDVLDRKYRNGFQKRWGKDAIKSHVILISPYASKNDVLGCVDYIWKTFKNSRRPSVVIRTKKYKKRDEIVSNLWGRGVGELKRIAMNLKIDKSVTNTNYKDILVSKILREKYKINVTPENIRKIASIQKEARGL